MLAMSKTSSTSPALKLAIKAMINVLLIWLLTVYLPSYFSVIGGPPAYVIIGSILTLMNMFLRPLLAIITFPFRLLFTLLTTIAVNAFFLFVMYEISLKMDPSIVVLTIAGGLTGWILVSLILGVVNWILKHLF